MIQETIQPAIGPTNSQTLEDCLQISQRLSLLPLDTESLRLTHQLSLRLTWMLLRCPDIATLRLAQIFEQHHNLRRLLSLTLSYNPE